MKGTHYGGGASKCTHDKRSGPVGGMIQAYRQIVKNGRYLLTRPPSLQRRQDGRTSDSRDPGGVAQRHREIWTDRSLGSKFEALKEREDLSRGFFFVCFKYVVTRPLNLNH